MGSKQRNTSWNKPIVCIGIVATIGVACITGLATNAAVSKFNADADRAYAAAVEDVRAKQLADWLAQHSGSSGDQLNYVPEIGNVPIAPTDIIEIDGKFYINADLIINPDGSHATDCPCYYCRYGKDIDENEKIVIDGKEYIYITDPNDPYDKDDNSSKPDSDDNVGTNPFEGIDYISIDIDGNAIYLIEKGDTLSYISGKVGYSVDELAEYNHIKNVNLIYEGSSLRIPVTSEFYEYIQGVQSSTDDDASSETSVPDIKPEVEVVLPEVEEPVVTTAPVVEEPVPATEVVTTVVSKPAPAPAPKSEPIVTTTKSEPKPATEVTTKKPNKPVETTKVKQTEPVVTEEEIIIVDEPFETWEDDILYDYEEIFLDEIFED